MLSESLEKPAVIGIPKRLEQLRDSGCVSDLAFHFAEMMVRLDGRESDGVGLAACLVSHWTNQGNVCVDLASLSGREVFDGELTTPPLQDWQKSLRSSSVVGRPGEVRPLILDDRSRLYLYRYWDFEKRLARALLSKASLDGPQGSPQGFRAALDRIMPRSPFGEVDWQRVAAAQAYLKKLCVISGGPGTGKTWTVVRILAAISETLPGTVPLRVALTAPTGKAAARLEETVREAKRDLPINSEIRDQIPDVATTIHRLLGVQRHSLGFRHNRENLLALDVLIVDEASMVDLPLMTRLVEALPQDSRLILLGDRNQLSSIETGAVIREICALEGGYSAETAEQLARLSGEILPEEPTGSQSAVRDCVVVLRRSFRFERGSGIDALSRAVRDGEAGHALTILRSRRGRENRVSVSPARSVGVFACPDKGTSERCAFSCRTAPGVGSLSPIPDPLRGSLRPVRSRQGQPRRRGHVSSGAFRSGIRLVPGKAHSRHPERLHTGTVQWGSRVDL